MANDLGARKKTVVRQLDLGVNAMRQLYLDLDLVVMYRVRVVSLDRLRILTVLH